jgi:hypothetical protein
MHMASAKSCAGCTGVTGDSGSLTSCAGSSSGTTSSTLVPDVYVILMLMFIKCARLTDARPPLGADGDEFNLAEGC